MPLPTSRPPRRGGLHDLKVAEARWRAVLDTVRDAIIAIDTSGQVTLFNPAAEQIFGYRADEVCGANVSLLMPAPYRDEHDEYLRRYQRTGDAHAIGRIRSVSARRKGGEVFPIELSVSESRVANEVLYTAVIRDISQRIAAENALRSERDFAERLIETAQIIIMVLDPAGRIVRYNAYMEQVSGRRLADVTGADWLTAFVPELDRARVGALFATAWGEGQLRGQVTPIVSVDGSERQIEWSLKTLLDGGGSVAGLLCTGQDVTDRLADRFELHELRRVAQQRERLADIGAITTKIVHDFGNPLAAVSMQAQLILRRARRGDFTPVEPVRQSAEQIVQTLRRLETLVQEFTDFAREQRLSLRPIKVGRFLISIVELWKALAAERGIALELGGVEGAVVVRADEAMLRRVLDNLIKNAIEAIGQGPGLIAISAVKPDHDRIHILVEDTGPGVVEGIDVFKLFETTKAAGTGIGLAVVRQILTAHGGAIEHFPRSPHGTIFRIELPLNGPIPGEHL